MGILRCLWCPYTTDSAQDLLDHEDAVHGSLVEELEGVDGNEEEQWEEEEQED
jgi:hypothetical protein